MKRSRLRVPAASREMIDTFVGYDHNRRIPDGAFYDMENMTSDEYPLLSPRKPRGLYAQAQNITGMICKDALCYVDGAEFVINQVRVDMELNDAPKLLVSMGAKVVIFPDKKYINTLDLTDWGSLEAEWSGDKVDFFPCNLDGSDYTVDYSQADEPEAPENGDVWLDISQEPRVMKKWSASSGMWVSMGTTYVKISSIGIGQQFSKYDGVEISGNFDSNELKNLMGSHVIWNNGDDYIVVTGLISSSCRAEVTEEGASVFDGISICRRVPDMDYVVECGNRLWGCRYGLQSFGGRIQDPEVVNVIYCSKLGDEKNWSCFMGTSMDSWFGNLGTDGRFTGAVNYLGHPLFFKENYVHKVYVSSEGAHRIVDTALRGVQAGCERSLAMVGEILYYKTFGGVCAYDGSLPVDISRALGGISYENAVAGVMGKKYYISLCSKQTGQPFLFVYDTEKGIWHKEDSLQASLFCTCAETLYCAEYGTGRILAMDGSGTPAEEAVPWMVQTGMIGLSLPDRKYVNQLQLRLSIAEGASLTAWGEYDSSGKWVQLFHLEEHGTGSFPVCIRPVRCDHMRIRLEGRGDVKIFSLTKQIIRGSERK